MVMPLGTGSKEIKHLLPVIFIRNFRSSASNSSRPTILPSYLNGIERHNNDPSHRVVRCISMDTVRRNEHIPLNNPNEKLCTDSLLKQKMCSSKKHNHTSAASPFSLEYLKSKSLSTATTAATINSNYQPLTSRHQYQNSEFPLQKPRVYAHDDRPFVGRQQQQQNILSSSSASSSLSVKDKTIKEFDETR